jgi:outer membrane protein W
MNCKFCFAFALMFFLLMNTVKAQNRFQNLDHYKPFKVQADIGYARPIGSGTKAGVLLALEPKLNITDMLTVGLRFESTAMARGYLDVNNTEVSGEAGLGIAVLPTIDYYFNTRTVRPFIGAGGGIYNMVSVEASTGTNSTLQIPAVTKLGGMLRAGFEIWHIRTGFHYNFVGKTRNINNSYYGITIGLVFGGGVKDEYTGRE